MILRREQMEKFVTDFMDEEFKKEENDLAIRIGFRKNNVDYDVLIETFKKLEIIYQSC
jgi:hypothetical protein